MKGDTEVITRPAPNRPPPLPPPPESYPNTVTGKFLKELAASSRSGKYMAPRRRREWVVRLVLMLAALAIAQFGTALFVMTAIGAEPYSVFIQGMAGRLALSFGVCHMAITFSILLFFLMTAREYILPGTFLCTFFAGPFVDVYCGLLGGWIHPGLPLAVRVVVMAAGCVIVGVGIAFLIKIDAGLSPSDILSVFLTDRLHIQYRWAKMGVDITLALVGFVLGGVLGIGTLVAVFVVGPVAQQFFGITDRLVRKVVKRFR
ncbi:MAG: hypothetical protein LUE17_17605 [Planctomycetaceae bacterium]|nr:hypothetical protein [Planctomycetaceae bacterium]